MEEIKKQDLAENGEPVPARGRDPMEKLAPSSWEECLVKMVMDQKPMEYIGFQSTIEPLKPCDHGLMLEDLPKSLKEFENLVPKGYADRILALCQLLICIEVYRDGWKPDWDKIPFDKPVWLITNRYTGKFEVVKVYRWCRWTQLLVFDTEEKARLFLENFRYLLSRVEVNDDCMFAILR